MKALLRLENKLHLCMQYKHHRQKSAEESKPYSQLVLSRYRRCILLSMQYKKYRLGSIH